MPLPNHEPSSILSVALGVGILLGASTGEEAVGQGMGESGPGTVPRLTVRVEAEYPHDPLAFTQGLLWHDGSLYESTGQYAESTLRKADLRTGSVERSVDLPESEFGEGLARVGERLIQLTWTTGLAHVWDLETFDHLRSLRYDGEGWGLCFDGETIFMSDGSATIKRRDPDSFAVVGSFEVHLEGRPVADLNELECAEGWLYANIYQTDWIARIDSATGEVVALVDASPLRSRLGAAESIDVLNGIAYLPDRATFLLTGKYWPKVFEVIFVE